MYGVGMKERLLIRWILTQLKYALFNGELKNFINKLCNKNFSKDFTRTFKKYKNLIFNMKENTSPKT